MKDQGLVNALRCCADDSLCKCCNCELYCEKNCVGVLKNDAADLIENQQRHIEAQAKEIDALRNELCLKCGNYTLAHEGACNGCRWREMHHET